MKKNKGGVIDETQSRLLTPPHIVNRLIDLLVGSWHPNLSEQHGLTTHLSECSDCRIAFSILLVTRGEYEAKQDYSESFIQDLSAQFIAAHEQIESRRLERISAYVDTIVNEGQGRADKQFPVLAQYMKKSPSFRSMIGDMLKLLRETETTD